jgi:thioredoxin reductase (NADPH)
MPRKGCRVHVLIRGDSLAASMSRYLVDEIERTPAIKVHLRTQVRELIGSERLEGMVIDTAGTRSTLGITGLFSFIGADPNSEWLDVEVTRDDHGFILTGLDLDRDGSRRLPLETSVAGVFAVGDIRHGSIKRVATAVGEGAMAVRLVHERLASPVQGS